MSTSRRRFLQQASSLGLLYGGSRSFAQMSMPMGQMQAPAAPAAQAPAKPMLNSLQLKPFVEPLPLPEVLRPTLQDGKHTATITMREIYSKVHPDVPATRMWSYNSTPLGPVIEARSGEPLEIRWVNSLPPKHFLPIDFSLHGSGKDIPEVRTIAHMHGAKTRTKDDGHPEDWFPVGGSRTALYPLEQDATMLWYHDHAMGLNRLNTYAGLFGMCLVRDSVEDSLHLPSGPYELPLILYDRNFSTDGQLLYGVSDDPEHPWISEFSGDGLLVNGKIRPYFNAEPRLYRLRIVNVANSRFFSLSLSNQQPLLQIGSDQGLLSAPVEMKNIFLAPAERADILVDLSQSAGETLYLRTGATNLVELRVAKTASSNTPAYSIPKTLRPVVRIAESEATVTRTITMQDFHDRYGGSMLMLLNRKHWHEPVTEMPKLNSTEIWEFINTTEDTHPMHLHLVRFQILDRQVLDTFAFVNQNQRRFISAPTLPAANEQGWKDVVQCPPGMITRIIARFEGYPGKYLYHCHILEHEANDMMRPFEVIA